MFSYYDENTVLYYNGAYLKAAEAKIDLYGQSLHYGYAVFEGIRAYKTDKGTRIFKPKEHFVRLKRSCELIGIPFDMTPEELETISYEVMKRSGLEEAYIRPLVICPPNMSLGKAKESHLLLCAWAWNQGYGTNHARLMVSSFIRPHPKAFHMDAKAAGHYVNSIMATTEAKEKGYSDALLLDVNGNVAEGPGANIFFQKEGVLYTPPKGYILAGITRSTVMDLCAEMNIPVVEKFFTLEELQQAEGAFYVGTAAEVLAIESVNDVAFSRPFDDTFGRQIQDAYSNLVREKEYKTAAA
jgi:branched-chain amino acid aminotransferase